MSVQNYKYVIIGGVPKAGTTSVFEYLKEHPMVNASTLKETRFFLDQDYPLSSNMRYNGNNIDEYNKYFDPEKDTSYIRVEATPDYIFCKTPENIVELLPHAKLIFIVRDPIERIVSWYKFSIQKGFINKSVTFDEYVNLQLQMKFTNATPIHLRAVQQCRQEIIVKQYAKIFGDRLKVIEFSELSSDPRKFMLDLSDFCGLNGSFFNDFNFTIKNKSKKSTYPNLVRSYDKIRRYFSQRTLNKPFLRKIIAVPNRLLKNIFHKSVQADEVFVSSEIRLKIANALRDEHI